MNDPQTLGFYTTMQLFRNNRDSAGAVLQFPPTLSSQQRRIVHTLAQKLNLQPTTHGIPPERYVTVSLLPSPTPESSTLHVPPLCP